MNKKLLASALALTLTFGAVGLPAAENMAISASARTSYYEGMEDVIKVSGDYKYIILKDGTISICGYKGSSRANIPSEIDGKKVTVIGREAFIYNLWVKNVIIPDGVTTIDSDAFEGCSSLTSVSIPNSVKKIGSSAFEFCALKSITIPNGVTSIGNQAFNGCRSLTSVTIPKSVNTIESGAFFNCQKLKSVNIPDSVRSIGNEAFGYYYGDANGTYKKVSDFKISCYAGTAAEKYAKNNGFTYELIDKGMIIPAKVSGVKVSSTTANSAKLTWSKVKAADGYVIYRYDSAKKAWVKVASTTKNTYTVSKLKSGTTYKFVVKAYKKSDSKNVFGTKSATVTAVTNPAKPTLKATAGKKKAVLKWNKVSGATGYKVYYKTSPKGAYKLLKTTKSVSLTKTGLTSGKTYYFVVKSYKTVGKTTKISAASTVKSVKVK